MAKAPKATTFSTRSNAKRAAEKAIRDGTAPSMDYGLRTCEDGRFEIVWKDRAAEARQRLGMPPTTEAAEKPLDYRDRLLDADAARRQTMAEPKPSNRQPSRKVELDMAAATGVMPAKPIMTSKANPHYQKRFDQLEKLALAGDWDGVRGYEVNGVNSYAKMVKQYRDRLIAAHAATQ